MNSPTGGPPQGVPTLTEVVDWHDNSGAPASIPAAPVTRSFIR